MTITFIVFITGESVRCLNDCTPNYKDKFNHRVIMKLMFPDKVFSEKDGFFTDDTIFHNKLIIASIEKGSFIEKGREEYLIVVKEAGGHHLEGFDSRIVAVIDNNITKLLSSVKKFVGNDSEILTFKGRDISYIFYSGTLTYGGYTYSSDNTEIGCSIYDVLPNVKETTSMIWQFTQF